MSALKSLSIGLLACLPLLGSAAPLPANPPANPPVQEGVQGEWRNTKNTIHMRVRPCGNAMCGTVIWAGDQQRADAKKGSGKDLLGATLVRDLRQGEDGKWRGRVYVPDIDATASATVIQLNSYTLRITGCTLVGILCRTQHWHRLK